MTSPRNKYGAKLTPAMAVNVRERYWRGNETMGAIARSLGVCRETVARCVRGETFTQYGGPVPGGREMPPGQLEHEAALDAGIERDAPMPSKGEIAASLERLKALQPKPAAAGNTLFDKLMDRASDPQPGDENGSPPTK